MYFTNFHLLDNHQFFKIDEIQSMLKALLDELKIKFSVCELIKRDTFRYDLLFDDSFDYISKIELDIITRKPIINFKSNIILDTEFKKFIESFTNKIDIFVKNRSGSSFYNSTSISINHEINYKICIFAGRCTFLTTLNKNDIKSQNYDKLIQSFSNTNICRELYPDYSSTEIVENFDSIVTLLSIENI